MAMATSSIGVRLSKDNSSWATSTQGYICMACFYYGHSTQDPLIKPKELRTRYTEARNKNDGLTTSPKQL
nr:455_t:CDS:2 [Entrophospora candida]